MINLAHKVVVNGLNIYKHRGPHTHNIHIHTQNT